MMLRSSNSIVLLTVILASLCLLSAAGQTRKCVKVLKNFEKKCVQRGLEFPGCDVHQNKLSESKMRKCGKQAKKAKNCGFSCAPKAIDGGYTEFSAWSACSVPCGGGQQTRSRTCTNPVPSNGGAECVGESVESQNCNDKECPGNSCPSSHPFVYLRGEYCCATNREKVYAPNGASCDGGIIGFDSSCCKDDDHSKCRSAPCDNYANTVAGSPESFLGSWAWMHDGETQNGVVELLTIPVGDTPGTMTYKKTFPPSNDFQSGSWMIINAGPPTVLRLTFYDIVHDLEYSYESQDAILTSPVRMPQSKMSKIITRTVAQCTLPNQVLPGAQINIAGLGYTSNIFTLEACVDLCKNTPGCAAVGRKTAANRCYMKTAAYGNLIKNTTPYATNGVALCCLDDTCTRSAPLW